MRASSLTAHLLWNHSAHPLWQFKHCHGNVLWCDQPWVMTSLRDQAGQVALAEGIKTNFCINKSGISAIGQWDLSWPKSQAKSLSGVFLQDFSSRAWQGHPLEKSSICFHRESYFLWEVFPTVYGSISVEIIWIFKTFLYFFFSLFILSAGDPTLFFLFGGRCCMASGNAYFTCATCGFVPDPIQKITGLEWVVWLSEAFISHLPAEPGVKGDKTASLCGQLEWISDQRLPSRCHIQCYPFPINQRPGSEPLVQSRGLLNFFFLCDSCWFWIRF